MRLPEDAAAILALDVSFTTALIYQAEASDHGVGLSPQRLPRPIIKRFPLDDLDTAERPWDLGWVAIAGPHLVGFLAAEAQAWNRRLVIWHFYVDAPLRGRGVGRALMAEAKRRAGEAGARRLWAETSSLNAPGLAAYRALGFRLCGLDLSLYSDTPADGETALFLTCDL